MAAPGLLLALVGCVSIYLSSPHQSWRAHAWPARPARLAGTGLLAAGMACLLQSMQAVAAVFTWATWLMLLWTLLPWLGAGCAWMRGR